MQDAVAAAVGEVNEQLAKHTKIINGTTYKIKPLDAEMGLIVYEKLISILAPILGVGLDAMNYDEVLDGSPTTFVQATTILSRALGEQQELKNFSEVLLDGLVADGKEVSYKDQFKCNYGDWMQVFMFALKENFESAFTQGGFTGQLSEMFNMALQQLPQSKE